MTRLEELIQTLCPDGVEVEYLGEFASIDKGQQLNLTRMTDDAPYPVMNGGINPSGYFDQYNTEEDTIAISQGGASAGYINFIETKFWAGAHCYVVKPKKSTVDNKFLYYLLKNSETEIQSAKYGAGIPGLNKSTLESLVLPLPPLPVQEEIVCILDTFTALETELEKQLEAELAARTKQCEHYRNELLSFDSKSKIIEKLLAKIFPGEVTYLRLGGKEGICEVVPSGVDKVISNNERSVKLCNYMDVYNNRYITDAIVEKCTNGSVSKNEYERFVLRKGQVLLTKDSETREDIAQSAYVCKDFEDVVCGYHLAVLTPVKSINSKYLNYVLQSTTIRSYFSKMANGVSRYGLKLKNIEDALIPVPPLEVQEQIVAILDRFESLVNDLKSGLPAEISLRRKQYEYYRDKLLTFKPIQPPL